MKPTWWFVSLDRMPYENALKLQRRLVDAVRLEIMNDGVVLFLEHPPVFTLGRRGGLSSLTVAPSFLREKQIPVIQAERGGDITFHGPGQLVGYPVVHLKKARLSVVDYVTGLEEVMIRTAADFEIITRRDQRNRGVWIRDNKLGSVGIHVRRSVAFHGFALNVNPDLAPFSWMNPCGLHDVGVTSIAMEQQDPSVDMAAARRRAKHHLATVFRVALKTVSISDVHLRLEGNTGT